MLMAAHYDFDRYSVKFGDIYQHIMAKFLWHLACKIFLAVKQKDLSL